MGRRKPRAAGEGSLRERKDGRWEARVSAGFIDGRRNFLYAYGDSQADAKDQLDQLRQKAKQIKAGRVRASRARDRETVADFMAKWLRDVVKPTRAWRTWDSYRQVAKLYITPAVGQVRIDRLTSQNVQEMVGRMSAKGLSPSTIRYARAVLRRALRQARKQGKVAENVAAGDEVDLPSRKDHDFRWLSTGQAGRFLESVAGDRLEALYRVAVGLGLRAGEIRGLRWSDIDLDAGVLHVRYQMQRGDSGPTLTPPKSKRSRRDLPIAPPLAAALMEHIKRQLRERDFAGSAWKGDGWGLVFSTTIGTPLDHTNLTRAFHAALERAGLPRIRFHDLRHSCASLLKAQGVDLRTIMEVLGHSQISVTADLYTHVGGEIIRDAVSRLDAALNPAR